MSEKNVGSEKNFGSEKILGPTIRFLVCSVIVDFGVVLLLTWVIWTPKLSQKPLVYVSNFILLVHLLLIDFGEGFLLLLFLLFL